MIQNLKHPTMLFSFAFLFGFICKIRKIIKIKYFILFVFRNINFLIATEFLNTFIEDASYLRMLK